ncbi:EF-hand calcium-binding domain-containing protein 1-like isoform X1 [Bombus pyrosoma]|uniref:EF-hand calcium-binding domain-containing protein 1-like isoform X1 n=2 Tax=Bombus pyrosoma TaxID=396416 RepID=UPI001CB93DF3|nr:EF-hand calcium-binding domain-containing protein 1-like isoform X1 [Bombus pyrosoma]
MYWLLLANFRRMSRERSLTSSAKARMDHGSGVGVGVSVSVGADNRGAVNLCAGATLMKSVSIFLMSGRKASVNSNRQTSGSPKHEPRRKHRRRMPVAGITRSSAYTAKLIESLKRKTRFCWSELDNLCKLYKKLTTSGQQQVGQSGIIGRRTQSNQTIEGIDRVIFRELLHNTFKVITEDVLVERMFCCWDRENEGIIRLEPWIMGLDLYLRGSLREKIEFCFKVYDLNNDGFITKDEIFQLFKNCLIKQPGEEDPDEAVKDLSELALKKLDVDRDGKISFQDYKVAVTEEPLLLEAFGQCLSTDENCAAILASLRS